MTRPYRTEPYPERREDVTVIKDLTVEEYVARYTGQSLTQLALFAKRELDNPDVAREYEKILKALDRLGLGGENE